MKSLIITEEEKSRILGMHQSAVKKEFLMEQTLGGSAAPGVMSIPGYETFIKSNPKSGTYTFLPGTIRTTLVNYLGGQGSQLSGIIGKTIIFTAKSLYYYEQMGNFQLQNNSLDGVIVGSFVPKAWYHGGSYQQPDNKSFHYLYLFNREITTNYSGDINKPFLVNGTAVERNTESTRVDLQVPIQEKQYGLPYIYENENIPKFLQIKPNTLKLGTDYIRIRTYDNYCPELKGYASYLEDIGYGALGNMFGVNKK
jgi:hypothetical protein